MFLFTSAVAYTYTSLPLDCTRYTALAFFYPSDTYASEMDQKMLK